MPISKVGLINNANTTVKGQVIRHRFKTRVFYNASANVSESTNWKLDLYKANNMSYAQVLKTAVKCKTADAKTGSSINAKVTNITKSVIGSRLHRPINKAPKDNDSNQRGYKVKVRCTKGQSKVNHQETVKNEIQCTNRFAPLSVDDVCDMNSAMGENVVCTSRFDGRAHESKANSSKSLQKSGKASNNDASKQSPLYVPSNKETYPDSSSKYDLPLRIKNKSITYKQVLPSCPTLQLWDAQNKFKFGFIPLGSQLMPNHVNPVDVDADPITLHKCMVESKEYNFLQNQINLKSQLNPDIWDQYLHDYWDKQLPLLIRFGFPLDYNREGALRSQETNHASAIEFPDDIQAYLDGEGKHKAILGPFKDRPIKNLHISPMMTRKKPNATHRRVIIDLSFPQGQSVNTGIPRDQYLGTPFILKLPTVDTITEQIKVLGRGCKLYKVDISRAFRHVKLDPKEYDLLGLCHDRYYVDTCLPFGYRNGSALFQRLSDAVRHIMRQRRYGVVNYIDDILGIGLPSQIDASFNALRQLLQDLGLQVSDKKMESPTTRLNCLGKVLLVATKTLLQ